MGFARIKVAGMPATHAIRWMANQGWSFKTICSALNNLGAGDIKQNTVRCQIAAAKRDGAPSIETWQEDALRRARNDQAPKQTEDDMLTKSKDGIEANYERECPRCGQMILKGQRIKKFPIPGANKELWCHVGCQPADGKQEAPSFDEALAKRTSEAKLEGLDALSELLSDRIKLLEEQTAKQAKQIELLRKEQPPREIVLVKPDKKKVKLAQHTHPIFEQLLFHVQAGDNVMLVGPRGCGKTTVCEQLAKALERPYGFQSLSGGVTEAKLFGRVTPDINTGKNIYHRALFAELFEEGGVFLLDEVDAADPNVLLSINSGLANGQLALDRPKNPIANRHAEFVCVAAANTWGNGADRQYVGRNQQDSAFTERFVQLAMDYDKELERALCPGANELLDRMHRYRERVSQNRLERTVSTRFICRAYKWLELGKDLSYVENMLFAGWREDEIRKVKGGSF